MGNDEVVFFLIQDGHDDDDDDDGIGFDFTAASHDLSTQAQQDMGNEELSGSNLVAQPRKVCKPRYIRYHIILL